MFTPEEIAAKYGDAVKLAKSPVPMPSKDSLQSLLQEQIYSHNPKRDSLDNLMALKSAYHFVEGVKDYPPRK